MPFYFEKTGFDDLIIVRPRVFNDSRGEFLETYKQSDFVSNGIEYSFVQDNRSISNKHVLRGIHFQRKPKAQGKLVSVIKGRVWDVAVDLRKDSSTFLKWFGYELTSDSCEIIFIPPGFGHGFLSLEDQTIFQYKCTEEYSPEHDSGIRWDDPTLSIEWPSKRSEVVVSEKDQNLLFYDEEYL